MSVTTYIQKATMPYEFDSLRDDVSVEWFEKVIYIHKNKLSFLIMEFFKE